ncbi:MAG: ABC transporter substrate-binding protein [Actinomycetaceae bacterium]|nr:ABC transporter substrate-binding protein [Actinomycetaceae bacterium]
MKKNYLALPLLAALGATGLAACSDPETASPAPTSSAPDFAIESIEVNEEIAKLVPEGIKERNELRNGASTDYAPAEFRDSDGRTPIGYDIDITKALARVMGLEDGTTEHAEFPTIIPALGTKFDVGISSFTITGERLEQVNMISYVQVGSSYAVKTGNPKKFDPNNACGSTIGVQTGTYQHDYANELSKKCEADGKPAIEVMPHDLNTDAITKLVGEQYDAVLSDSTVTGYAISRTNGEIEQVGEIIESEPQGVAVAKEDTALAEAIQKAMQYLMDEGYLDKILAQYGAEDAGLKTAELNPGK